MVLTSFIIKGLGKIMFIWSRKCFYARRISMCYKNKGGGNRKKFLFSYIVLHICITLQTRLDIDACLFHPYKTLSPLKREESLPSCDR